MHKEYQMTNEKWYDKVARIYDLFTIRFYKKARKTLIENLKIKKDDRVLIIACGTGQNFKLIEDKIGENGEIIAVDYSRGMLDRAEKRIHKNQWENIRLIEQDARKLTKTFLENKHINTNFDILIGELAFSVIPEWKGVMKNGFSLLNEDGKIGLLDWYREQNDWLTKTVDFFAEAETSRNTIQYAKTLSNDFKIISKFFFQNVFVGIGQNTEKMMKDIK